MLEIRIIAPELSEAINNLAKALAPTQCGCGHAECHQNGENIAHIDNSGTINVEVPQTAEIAPVMPTAPVVSTTPAVVPVANPTVPTSAPQSVPTVPTVPTAPTPVDEVPTAVPTAAPQYTLDMIAKAGAMLIDAGKIAEVSALLGKYGVDALVSLDPSMYGAVATDLRALGAQI